MNPVEEHLRSVFKTEIGANTVDAGDSIKEGITFNHHKGVFQAALKVDDQDGCFVKSGSQCSSSEKNLKLQNIHIGFCYCCVLLGSSGSDCDPVARHSSKNFRSNKMPNIG